jgi:hypothetical protein
MASARATYGCYTALKRKSGFHTCFYAFNIELWQCTRMSQVKQRYLHEWLNIMVAAPNAHN